MYVSAPTIHRILKQHRVPRVSLKRYRPGPRRRRELHVPGQSVQVDVKHLKLGGRRFYQFIAIDEATRYRVLRVYAHTSIKSATEFVEAVRRRLPMAIQRIQTDHGSEFGTDFTWHLRDLGVSHRHIPRGCPESTGKVERSHRTDADEFYRRMIVRSPGELAQKLRQWEYEYNPRRPHLALRGKTPAERLCELRIACDPVQQIGLSRCGGCTPPSGRHRLWRPRLQAAGEAAIAERMDSRGACKTDYAICTVFPSTPICPY